jgi:hypothetical protein
VLFNWHKSTPLWHFGFVSASILPPVTSIVNGWRQANPENERFQNISVRRIVTPEAMTYVVADLYCEYI